MVNIAIVGVGGIAQRHIAALKEVKNARIVGIVDIRRENAELAAKACGAEVFEKLEDCLDKVDLVSILTPPSTHRELAVKAFRAGKHVICEKPISISIEDAQIMVEEAAKNNVKLMIAFNMRFRKGFIYLKELIQSGKLGDVINFWSQRMGMGVGTDYNWRTDPKLLCGMSIESLSHDIDMMRWLVGDVADVRANVFGSHKSLPGFDNNANVAFSLASGGTACIHASWCSYLGMNSRGIIGTKGTALVQGKGLWDLDMLRIKTEDMKYECIELINDPLDISSYIGENQHFVDCVEKGLEPSITGEDGLRTLKISHAILKSHKDKEVVSIV